jgi:hypothetical protein
MGRQLPSVPTGTLGKVWIKNWTLERTLIFHHSCGRTISLSVGLPRGEFQRPLQFLALPCQLSPHDREHLELNQIASVDHESPRLIPQDPSMHTKYKLLTAFPRVPAPHSSKYQPHSSLDLASN